MHRVRRKTSGAEPGLARVRKPGRASRSLLVECLEDRCLLAAVTLSNADQLMIELINRARANPDGEAARYSIDLNEGLSRGTISNTPKQPLAPNQALIDMAEFHSQWMLENNNWTTDGPTGVTMDERIRNVYGNEAPGTLVGENIEWVGVTGPGQSLEAAVASLHEKSFLDPAQRQRLLRADFDEVGVGVVAGTFHHQGVDYNATLVTVDFGSLATGQHFFTGVAFADPSLSDHFFSFGEGLSGVRITAQAVNGGTTYTTTTDQTGGYTLPVAPGSYDLTAQDGALARTIQHTGITLGTANVKVDFLVGASPPPVAAKDAAMCWLGGAVEVNLLANDTATAGLVPESTTIMTEPSHGAASIDPQTGRATYTPDVGYVGLDTFMYRVSDLQGYPSAAAKVSIAVIDPTKPAWQNPARAVDVDGNGVVTALDVLLIINALNSRGPGTLAPPSPQTTFPAPYLDVSGNGKLEPLDVLLVINHINSQPPSSEGEGDAFADDPWDTAPPALDPVIAEIAGPVAHAGSFA